jgi:beta-lactamase class A
MWTRRQALTGGLAVAACAPVAQQPAVATAPDDQRFAEIERRIGGRVGVYAIDTGSGARLTHRAAERFAMCSSFKWLLAAQILHMDMHMPGFRDQRVLFDQSDILSYAPVTRTRIGADGTGVMTVAELCEAMVVTSDNTAANLLLEGAMGPEGLTRFLRESGDPITRLDRTEPELNENAPGDERDTTTPETMAHDLRLLLLEERVLNQTARDMLIGWMVSSQTGRERLRAGLPGGWRVGDKTGTSVGMHNATNDVAIAWPPGRAPILTACYLSDSAVEFRARVAAHAEIGRIVAQTWG